MQESIKKKLQFELINDKINIHDRPILKKAFCFSIRLFDIKMA